MALSQKFPKVEFCLQIQTRSPSSCVEVLPAIFNSKKIKIKRFLSCNTAPLSLWLVILCFVTFQQNKACIRIISFNQQDNQQVTAPS